MGMNWWNDGSTKVPRQISQDDGSQQYDAADIRGSSTFGDTSKFFDVPLEVYKDVFDLTGDISAQLLKSIEEVHPEYSAHSVAIFTAFYHGLPYPLVDDNYLPEKAAILLKQRAKMSAEQAAYLEAHTIIEGNTPQAQPTALDSPSVSATAEPLKTAQADYSVTGKTTFQQLLDWGVSQEVIERVIADKLPSTTMSIKEYATEKGAETSTFKDALKLR